MRNEWKLLRELVGKEAKTIKFHDSNHKIERIKLYGTSKISLVRSFEKLHYITVKMNYLQTNKRNIMDQFIKKVFILLTLINAIIILV